MNAMSSFKQTPQVAYSRPDSSKHLRSIATTEKEFLTGTENAEQCAQCGVLIFLNGKW